MALPLIDLSALPPEHARKVRDGELVHHFAYIDSEGGGCSNRSTAKQWVLVTNQRIIFEGWVKEDDGLVTKYVHQSGSILLSKISYVGVSSEIATEGCSNTKTANLRISSSGSEIFLAIPTQGEAARIQGVVDELISRL